MFHGHQATKLEGAVEPIHPNTSAGAGHTRGSVTTSTMPLFRYSTKIVHSCNTDEEVEGNQRWREEEEVEGNQRRREGCGGQCCLRCEIKVVCLEKSISRTLNEMNLNH